MEARPAYPELPSAQDMVKQESGNSASAQAVSSGAGQPAQAHARPVVDPEVARQRMEMLLAGNGPAPHAAAPKQDRMERNPEPARTAKQREKEDADLERKACCGQCCLCVLSCAQVVLAPFYMMGGTSESQKERLDREREAQQQRGGHPSAPAATAAAAIAFEPDGQQRAAHEERRQQKEEQKEAQRKHYEAHRAKEGTCKYHCLMCQSRCLRCLMCCCSPTGSV